MALLVYDVEIQLRRAWGITYDGHQVADQRVVDDLARHVYRELLYALVFHCLEILHVLYGQRKRLARGI